MSKLILALNVADATTARQLYEKIRDNIDLYKIGIDLWTRYGPELVRELRAAGAEIFLDLKFSDIPSVVAKAVEAVTELGIKMLTVHTMGGAEMLYAAARTAKLTAEKLGQEKPLLLGVTVLTSLDRAGLTQITGCSQEVANRVVALAELAQSMELDGVVASPKEIQLIKKACGPKFLVVTPGIRLTATQATDDQQRLLTPREAKKAGADYIVVGRPIYEAPDPIKVIDEIKSQMKGT